MSMIPYRPRMLRPYRPVPASTTGGACRFVTAANGASSYGDLIGEFMRSIPLLLVLLVGCIDGPSLDNPPSDVDTGPWAYTGEVRGTRVAVDVFVGEEHTQSDAEGRWSLESALGPEARVDTILGPQSRTFLDCDNHHSPWFYDSSYWPEASSEQTAWLEFRLEGFDPSLELQGEIAIEDQQGGISWGAVGQPELVDGEWILQELHPPGGAWAMHVFQGDDGEIVRDASISGPAFEPGEQLEFDLALEARDYEQLNLDFDLPAGVETVIVSERRAVGPYYSEATLYSGSASLPGLIDRLGWGETLAVTLILEQDVTCSRGFRRAQWQPIEGTDVSFPPWSDVPDLESADGDWRTAPSFTLDLPSSFDRFSVDFNGQGDAGWWADGTAACLDEVVRYPGPAEVFGASTVVDTRVWAASDNESLTCQSVVWVEN